MAWLIWDRRSVNEERAQAAAGRTVLVFAAAPMLLAGLPLLGAALAGVFSGPHPPIPDDITVGECIRSWLPLGAPAAVRCLGLALVPWQSTWWLGVIAVAFVVGLAILRRAPNHGGGVFLVALGAWALPRALDAVRQFHPAELPLFDRLPRINAPQLEVLDVAITVVVAVLALAWWTGRQRSIGIGPLLVILTVSTLLIDGASVAPSAPGAFLLAIAIVFPVLYELAFDSESSNRRPKNRPGRLLTSLGVRAMALTVLATLVIVDIRELYESTQVRLGFILFAVPLAALIVAATVRRLLRMSAVDRMRAETANPVALARPLIAGSAGGMAAVLVLAGLGFIFQPGLAQLHPTASARVEELRGRFTERDAELKAMYVLDPNVSPALAARWAEEAAWTANHPAPACAIELWSGWDNVVLDVREAGILLAAFADQPPGAPESEVVNVQVAFVAVGKALGEDMSTVRAQLHQAGSACAVR